MQTAMDRGGQAECPRGHLFRPGKRLGEEGSGKRQDLCVKADEELTALIREHFDLRPYGILKMLDLLRPIYQPTAAYGHFGREDIDATWEKTDKAEALRSAAAT